MQTQNDIQSKVIHVLSGYARPERKITSQSRLVADLGLDSMQVIEIVGALEEQFDIAIPLDDPGSIQTVAQVVSFIENLLTQKNHENLT